MGTSRTGRRTQRRGAAGGTGARARKVTKRVGIARGASPPERAGDEVARAGARASSALTPRVRASRAHAADPERSQAREAGRLAALIELGTQISAAKSTDELLVAVMDRLTALLHCEAATLFMFDAAREELWSRVLKGTAIDEIRIPARSGIAGRVYLSGQVLHLDDAYGDPRFNPEIDKASGFRTRSVIAAPLRHVSGRTLGVLEVLHSRVSAFSRQDRALVEGIASQIAAVLDSVLLMQELQARNEALRRTTEELAARVRELDALSEIERSLSDAPDDAALVGAALKQALGALCADAGAVLLTRDEPALLYTRTLHEESDGSRPPIRGVPRDGLAARSARHGEAHRAEDAVCSAAVDPSVRAALGTGHGAVLAVPLVVDAGRVGALELFRRRGGFTPADERLVELLAARIARALAVRQSRDEQELRSRLASIGQMISGVMHDLRTPLTVISGYAELMVDEEHRAKRTEMARAIFSQVQTVGAMQAETLAFARGERTILPHRVSMQEFTEQLRAQLAREFEGTRVKLEVTSSCTGTARFDEQKLWRAVLNLARNAIEAMPGGGRFELHVEADGGDLVLRAVDDGPGIPEAIVGRLFRSFVTAGKKSGTGLGLAIVKKIADEHGGSVSFETAPGRGSTFVLRIPAFDRG